MVDKVEFGEGTIGNDGSVDMSVLSDDNIDPYPALARLQDLLDDGVPARMATTVESGPYTGGTPVPTIDWGGQS